MRPARLDDDLAAELGNGAALARRHQERVVLLCRGPGHGHEPVGVVRRAVGQRPLLHGMRDGVDDLRIERLVAVDGAPQLLVDGLGQVLALDDVVEDVLAVDLLAGVLEVILRGANLVVGDGAYRRLPRRHATRCRRGRRACPASSVAVAFGHMAIVSRGMLCQLSHHCR